MRSNNMFLLMLSLLVAGAVTLAELLTTPTSSVNFLKMAPWLIARSAGVTAFLLLTVLVVAGFLMASVPNKSTWRISKLLLPFHRLLSLFLVAFLALHVIAIAMDPYVNIGFIGAFLPWRVGYRTLAVSLGSIALYAVIFTGLTARFAWLMPAGRWLTVHRVAFVTYIFAFFHSVLTGSDTPVLHLMYDISAVTVLFAALVRYAFVAKSRVVRELERDV